MAWRPIVDYNIEVQIPAFGEDEPMRVGALRAKRLGAEAVALQPLLADLTRYGLALLSVGLGTGASLLPQLFNFRVPAAPLTPFAVAIGTWYRCRGPTVLSVILSKGALYRYFFEPVRTIRIYTSEIPLFRGLCSTRFAVVLVWHDPTACRGGSAGAGKPVRSHPRRDPCDRHGGRDPVQEAHSVKKA